MRIESLVLRTTLGLFLIVMVQVQLEFNSTRSFAHAYDHMSQDQSAKHRQEYRLIKSGKGISKEGTTTTFTTYESSDGMMIFVRTEFFRSAAGMQTHFESNAKSFSEIIGRSDIKDRQGNIKGERVVGKYSADEPDIRRYAIMWTRESKISYIESVSLRGVLDFEDRFYKSHK